MESMISCITKGLLSRLCPADISVSSWRHMQYSYCMNLGCTSPATLGLHLPSMRPNLEDAPTPETQIIVRHKIALDCHQM